MVKIDKWHLIISAILIASIVVNGFLAGQLQTYYKVNNMSEASLRKAESAFKEALTSQTSITQRLVDSLATSNKVTNVQGNFTSKGNKSKK